MPTKFSKPVCALVKAGSSPPPPLLATLAVAAFILLIFVGLNPLVDFDKLQTDETGAGGGLNQLLYLIAFASLIYLNKARLRSALTFPFSLSLILLWCWLSLLWAIEPSIAFRRIVFTTVITASSFLSVSLLGRHHFMLMLVRILLAVVFVDILSVLLFPFAAQNFDILNGTSGWRGLHIEKNAAGGIAAISALILFFTFLETKRWLYLVGFLAATILLVNTQSKTSIALMPATLLIGVFYRYLYRNKLVQSFTWFILAVAFVVGSAAIFYKLPKIINFLDDPDVFTGRGTIWRILWDYSLDHWWLGSGYGSFWGIGPDGPSFNYGGWIALVYIGHNGYLDMLAQTGFPGLVLTIAVPVAAIGAMLFRYDESYRLENSVLVAVILFCTLHNFQETSYLDRSNPVWVSLLFSLALLRNPIKSYQSKAVPVRRQAKRFR